MKKLLLSLVLAVISLGTSSAAEVVFDFSNPAAFGYARPAASKSSDLANPATLTSGAGSIVFTQAAGKTANRFWNTKEVIDFRTYTGATLTFSLNGETITSIEFTGTALPTSDETFNVGTYDAATKSWTGSATSITMTVANTLKLSSITLKSGVASSVAAPVFSPAAGTYHEAQNVTISSATADAAIYYTLDETEPSEKSTKYTAAINVASTTTIKAIAIANGEKSSVSTATFTIEETSKIASIAELVAKKTNTDDTFELSGDITVAFVSKAYIFVEDATGQMLIYKGNTTLKKGDILGGMIGKFSLYNGLYEFIPDATANLTPKGTATSFKEPEVLTLAEISNNYDLHEAKLVTVKGVSFADGSYKADAKTGVQITQNGTSLLCYDSFQSIGDYTPSTTQTYNVTGYVVNFKGAQIAPRTISDIETGTGISSSADSKDAIYAANQQIVIETENAEVVSIYNALGQRIANHSIEAGKTTLSVSKGMYIVKTSSKVAKIVVN